MVDDDDDDDDDDDNENIQYETFESLRVQLLCEVQTMSQGTRMLWWT